MASKVTGRLVLNTDYRLTHQQINRKHRLQSVFYLAREEGRFLWSSCEERDVWCTWWRQQERTRAVMQKDQRHRVTSALRLVHTHTRSDHLSLCDWNATHCHFTTSDLLVAHGLLTLCHTNMARASQNSCSSSSSTAALQSLSQQECSYSENVNASVTHPALFVLWTWVTLVYKI